MDYCSAENGFQDMTKSATDVMHDIIVSAVTDAIDALKSASKGMPNILVRDINAIHANAAFADLPPELRAAITSSVRSAFNRLLKEGYTVSEGKAAPPRNPGSTRPSMEQRRPPRSGPRPPRPQKPRGKPGR